ncbi:MAG TPA: creatininase family protein [Polyangium sp.]|nr:creatininase family protein [Polyangium sp.]
MHFSRFCLANLTTETLRPRLAKPSPLVVLVPVGSVEPHGPHLPLRTDTIIGESAAYRAAEKLETKGVDVLVGPSIPYGVTRFAEGFAGAVSVTESALAAFLRAVVMGYVEAGFAHVCLINNHLEPAHDAAVRKSIEDVPPGLASVASPLTRRHARTLSAEFKSGACHAGRYETSLVLAADPHVVDMDRAAGLAKLDWSLSTGIREGKTNFLAIGMTEAYTGAPAEASAEEGRDLTDKLADMIVIEVEEGLGARQ